MLLARSSKLLLLISSLTLGAVCGCQVVPEPRADQPLSCAAPRRAAASGLCAAACATRGGDTLFLGLGLGFGSLVLALRLDRGSDSRPIRTETRGAVGEGEVIGRCTFGSAERRACSVDGRRRDGEPENAGLLLRSVRRCSSSTMNEPVGTSVSSWCSLEDTVLS